MAIKRIPISVVYKKKGGRKFYLETFTELPSPDKLITKRTNLLPKDCEIFDIGVGEVFAERYKKKYKIK